MTRPQHGADSAEGIRPYMVLMENRWEHGDRFSVRIAAAYGPIDACNQAQLDHPEYTGLRAEEAERDFADAELERAKGWSLL